MLRPDLCGGGAAFFLAGAAAFFFAGAAFFFLAWHLLGAVRKATFPFAVLKLQFVIYLRYIYIFFFNFDQLLDFSLNFLEWHNDPFYFYRRLGRVYQTWMFQWHSVDADHQ